jgi:hypothetical protein
MTATWSNPDGVTDVANASTGAVADQNAEAARDHAVDHDAGLT